MTNTQTWLFGLVLYFVGISVVWGLLSAGGVFAGSPNALDTNGFTYQQLVNYDANASEVPNVSTSFSLKAVLADLWSLFGWNISVSPDSNIYNFLPVIRLIFIYVPGLLLLATIAFTLRGI